MQQLSIIVPLLGHPSSFEDTLISVLENRPRDAEIVVPCDSRYADPYALDGEVRFVRADGPVDWVQYANVAARSCRGRVVHWLWPGARVAEGWCDAAIDALQFDDELASVAPVVVAENARWAGVVYEPPGRRVLQRCDRCRVTGDRRLRLDGPSFLAGWYRRTLLFAVGGWDASVGAALADLDLALRLQAQRTRCQLAVTSHIEFVEPLASLPRPGGFQMGRNAERMFRRHARQLGWHGSGTSLRRRLATDLTRTPPIAGALASWCGRACAIAGSDTHVSPWSEPANMQPAEEQLEVPAVPPFDELENHSYRRFDTAHSQAPSSKRGTLRRMKRPS